MSAPAAARVTTNQAGVLLAAGGHMVTDLYQGVLPALLPFLVVERGYSYAAVAGLTLAATLISSIVQPVFGWLGDLRPLRWLIPAGILLAGLGMGAVGLTESYALTWVAIAISGFGVAAFHPEGARAARQAAGNSNQAMSIFAVGGNGGFAVGSLLATPVFIYLGVSGAPLLAIPAVLMAVLLAVRLGPVLGPPLGARGGSGRRAAGRDDWPSFLKLTSVVVLRSVLFFGITSFLALYFIDVLGASEGVGGAMVTAFLISGAVGTVLGGWLADKYGRIVCMRLGFLVAIPGLAGMIAFGHWVPAALSVLLLGVGLSLPFGVFVMLGQDYLPNRIGTASGVTVGLAVTIGGLFNPLLGSLADATSLRLMLTVLLIVPVAAVLMTGFLREAAPPTASDRAGGAEVA